MNETADCEALHPLLAELATGALTGHERARVLRHVLGCVDGRQELAELARVADELLLLAPRRQPPPGFETAVVDRITALAATPRKHPRLRGVRRPRMRLAAAALALLAAAGAGAGIAYWQGAPDRQLATRYEQTLGVPGDHFPTAVAITTATGSVVGHVFFYPGSPAWVTVALTAAPASGNYAMSVVAKDGRRYPEGVCTVNGTTGTSGYPLPVEIADVAAIDLTQPGIRLTVHP